MNTVIPFLPASWPPLHTAALFGLLLLIGTLGGLLAKRVRWLPTITGFMAVGALMGPSGLGLLSYDMLGQTQVLVDVALGLILFKLGTALHPWMVIRTPKLIVTSLAESLLTFASVFGLMVWLGTSPLAAVIAAAIAVSSSPAVLIHVAHELHARGFVVDAAKALVALNNVFAFVLYSLAMPVALWNSETSWLVAIGLPAYQMLGAMVLGLLVAVLVTSIGRFTQSDDAHYRFALIVGAVMLVLGLSVAFGVSPLFANLTLGIACRGLQRRARLANTDLGSGADLFFIVLFVYAGAKLNVADVMQYLPFALALVAVRSLSKGVGVIAGARYFGYPWNQSIAISLTLIPMAGLAIGLVQTTNVLAPHIATQVSAIVLAAVAILETLGPPLVAYGLRLGDAVPPPEGPKVEVRNFTPPAG